MEDGKPRSYGFLERKRLRESAGNSGTESAGNNSSDVADVSNGNSTDQSISEQPRRENGGSVSEPLEDVGSSSHSSEPRITLEPSGESRSDARDGVSNSSPGGSGGTPKRGRHKRDCECSRCNDRRSSGGGNLLPFASKEPASGSLPREVDFSELFGFTVTGKKPKIDDALAGVCKLGGSLAVLGGKGEHWALTETEAKQLGKCLAACLDTIPAASKSAAMRNLTKIVPWFALVTTAAVVVYPRVLLTQQIEAAKQTEEIRKGIDARATSRPAMSDDKSNKNPAPYVAPDREPFAYSFGQ